MGSLITQHVLCNIAMSCSWDSMSVDDIWFLPRSPSLRVIYVKAHLGSLGPMTLTSLWASGGELEMGLR